jgi:carboxyl-terminal processing protease
MRWGLFVCLPLLATGLIAAEPSGDSRSLWQEVWSRVDQTFPMTGPQGVVWQGLRARVESLIVDSSGGDSEVLSLINGALLELGVSHLKLSPRFASVNIHSGERFGSGYAGFELMHIDGAWWVQSVEEHSDLSQAGVLPGWQLLRVGNQDLFSMGPIHPQDEGAWLSRWCMGPVGDRRTFEFLDLEQRPVSIEATLSSWSGGWTRPIGNLSPLRQRFLVRDEQGVRIIAFSYFTPEIMPQLLRSIRESGALRGLILDLRGNAGGIALMALGVAGVLTDQIMHLGVMHMKEGEVRFPVYPQASPYLGPLAILIDHRSASTSEILAAGLQQSGRARLFGSRSMGAALPSSLLVLHQRFTLQLPIATFTTPSGQVIEGEGIAPDCEVFLSKQDLIRGHDPVMSAAMEWILKSNSGSIPE